MMLTPEQLSYIRLRASSDVSSKTIIALLDHIDAQQARIAELEKDAARYRELRVNRLWSIVSSEGEELNLEALDSAVDDSMKE